MLRACFQVLFTVSGCDYISYFAGFGRAAFMNVFYQHACFITGDWEKGRLSDCSTSNFKKGYLAFLRLIGTLYFEKHYSAFVSLQGIETPQHLINSISATTLLEQHSAWYNDIRAIVSDRITDEDQRHDCDPAVTRPLLYFRLGNKYRPNYTCGLAGQGSLELALMIDKWLFLNIWFWHAQLFWWMILVSIDNSGT